MASVSKTSVCNMALLHVGQKKAISNIATDDTEEARVCRVYFDQSRRELLMGHPWRFATQRRALALLSELDSGEWAFQYEYPNRCIVLREIEKVFVEFVEPTLNSAVPFDIGITVDGKQRTILTNAENAVGIYTDDIGALEMFGPLFVSALSYLLAHKVAPSLGVDIKSRNNVSESFRTAIAEARAEDSSEAQGTPDPPAAWHTWAG